MSAGGKPAAAAAAPVADPGYTYLEEFDLLNFLKTNVPNTSSRCYANSTTQFLRMIPELYDALSPYAGERPIGPVEFVRFMHRRLKITNPAKFRDTYRSMLELTLGQCKIGQGQQDQSEFFNSLIRMGETLEARTKLPSSMQTAYDTLVKRRAALDAALAESPGNELLQFNSNIVNEDMRNIDKSRAKPGNKINRGPLWMALRPHLMCKTLTRYTLDVPNPACRKSHEVPTEKDDEDEASIELRMPQFPNGTPIQQCFNTRSERTEVPLPIMQSLVHADAACADIVRGYIDARRRQKINTAELETVRDVFLYDRVQRLKQESAPVFALTSKSASTVDSGFETEKAAFIKSPSFQQWQAFMKTPEFTTWSAKNSTKKPIEHPLFASIAGQKMSNATKKFIILHNLGLILGNQKRDAILSYLATIETPEYLAELQEKRERKRRLDAEKRAIEEELSYPIEKSLVFRELKKYLLIHIGYETGLGSLTENRFSGIMDPINLTMEDNSTRTYVPIAYVVHSGRTPNSGHYFTYVLIDGIGWFLYDDTNYRDDDTRARLVTPEEVMNVLMDRVPDAPAPFKPTFILYRDAAAHAAPAPPVNLSNFYVANEEEEEEEEEVVNLSELNEEEQLQLAIAQSMRKGGLRRRTRRQRIKKSRTMRRN